MHQKGRCRRTALCKKNFVLLEVKSEQLLISVGHCFVKATKIIGLPLPFLTGAGEIQLRLSCCLQPYVVSVLLSKSWFLFSSHCFVLSSVRFALASSRTFPPLEGIPPNA